VIEDLEATVRIVNLKLEKYLAFVCGVHAGYHVSPDLKAPPLLVLPH